MIKKIGTLFLCIIIVIGSLTSCLGKTKDPEESKKVEETNEIVTKTERQPPNIPENTNLGGQGTSSILTNKALFWLIFRL